MDDCSENCPARNRNHQAFSALSCNFPRPQHYCEVVRPQDPYGEVCIVLTLLIVSRIRYTFHEGISGMYALKASILSHLGRSNEAKECIWALEDISKVVSCMKSGDCEILYGRCGYLLSLLFTQTHVGEGSVRKDIIAHIAKQVHI